MVWNLISASEIHPSCCFSLMLPPQLAKWCLESLPYCLRNSITYLFSLSHKKKKNLGKIEKMKDYAHFRLYYSTKVKTWLCDTSVLVVYFSSLSSIHLVFLLHKNKAGPFTCIFSASWSQSFVSRGCWTDISGERVCFLVLGCLLS